MKKVLSFSLWGDNPTYNIGAIKNAELAKEFYTDFECWFYIHQESVPEETIKKLHLYICTILGANFCLIFSFSGIIFLASIAYLISQNKIYFKISQESIDKKEQLIQGVQGAIVMYIITFIISGYLLYKNRRNNINPINNATHGND